MNLIDKATNKKLNAVLQGLVGSNYLEKEVTKQWQEKHKILANLSNENKSELKKMDLKLLKGLKFEGTDCELQWEILKNSYDINPKQKEFALFLFNNYTKHSLKAQGFD